MKKGDTAYLMTWLGHADNQDETQGTICAQQVIIDSMGKQQGTAHYTKGRFIKHRIYVGSPAQVLVSTREEVIEFAKTKGLETYRKDKARKIADYGPGGVYSHYSWSPARLAKLEQTPDRVRVWFHDGEDQENIMIEGAGK